MARAEAKPALEFSARMLQWWTSGDSFDRAIGAIVGTLVAFPATITAVVGLFDGPGGVAIGYSIGELPFGLSFIFGVLLGWIPAALSSKVVRAENGYQDEYTRLRKAWLGCSRSEREVVANAYNEALLYVDNPQSVLRAAIAIEKFVKQQYYIKHYTSGTTALDELEAQIRTTKELTS